MAIEVSNLTNTQRLINRGARTNLINMIKAANPGTIYDNLNWDELRLEQYIFTMGDEGRTSTTYHLKVKEEFHNKYLNPTESAHFTIVNMLHIDDVYRDIFGSNTEFYLEEKGQVLDVIKRAMGSRLNLKWKTINTAEDTSTTDVLFVDHGMAYYDITDSCGYDAFLTSSKKDSEERLVFTFTPKTPKTSISLTSNNNQLSQPESSANRQDIYESA